MIVPLETGTVFWGILPIFFCSFASSTATIIDGESYKKLMMVLMAMIVLNDALMTGKIHCLCPFRVGYTSFMPSTPIAWQ